MASPEKAPTLSHEWETHNAGDREIHTICKTHRQLCADEDDRKDKFTFRCENGNEHHVHVGAVMNTARAVDTQLQYHYCGVRWKISNSHSTNGHDAAT